jgi:hypothetical protein
MSKKFCLESYETSDHCEEFVIDGKRILKDGLHEIGLDSVDEIHVPQDTDGQ